MHIYQMATGKAPVVQLDRVSVEQLKRMRPGTYVGVNWAGERAIIHVTSHDPVVCMTVFQGNECVRTADFYRNNTSQEYMSCMGEEQ